MLPRITILIGGIFILCSTLFGQQSSFEKGQAAFWEKNLDVSFEHFLSAKDSFLLTQNDTAVASSFERLATVSLHQGKTAESLDFIEQGLEYARKSAYAISYARLLLFKAEFYKMKGNREIGKSCWRELAPIYEPDTTVAISLYRIFGSIYQFDASDTSDVLLQKSLQLALESEQHNNLAGVYRSISRRREIQSDVVGAIQNAIQGLKYVPDAKSSLAANFNLSLAESFMQLGDTKKARAYAHTAVESLRDTRYKNLLHSAKQVMADICAEAGDFDCAEKNWEEDLEYFIGKNNNSRVLLIYAQRLSHFLRINDIEKAKANFDLINNSIENLDSPSIIDFINNCFTRYFYTIGDFKGAQKYLADWKQSKNKMKNGTSHISFYKYSGLLAEQKGDFVKGAEYLNKYKGLQDSVDQRKRREVIYLLEAEYKQAEIEKEIELFDGKNQIQAFTLNQRNRLLGLSAIFLFIMGGLSVLLFRRSKKNKQQKNEIQKNLKEKEILLDEIHSRVKNSLQTISSILNLQSRSMEDEKAIEAILEGKNRVISMALIHENLYLKNNSSQINLSDYFNQLLDSLFTSYNVSKGKIKLQKQFMEGFMNIDQVIPIGLILNELVSNALKHAFHGRDAGVLKVAFLQEAGQYQLSVTDDGVGIANSAEKKHSGFGSRIIKAFSKKLNASVSRIQGNGTSVVVSFAPQKKKSSKSMTKQNFK